MAIECVFGDWSFHWNDETIGAAFLPGHSFPLTWEGWQVKEVHASDGLMDTIPFVALAAHWARAHPAQLAALVGPVELGTFPRARALR